MNSAREEIARELHDEAFAYAHNLPAWEQLPPRARDRFLDRADRILTILRKAEWRPIETAPKDGTEVLVFEPSREGVQAWLGSGWFDNSLGWLDNARSSLHLNPTHWMPLPESPASEAVRDRQEKMG